MQLLDLKKELIIFLTQFGGLTGFTFFSKNDNYLPLSWEENIQPHDSNPMTPTPDTGTDSQTTAPPDDTSQSQPEPASPSPPTPASTTPSSGKDNSEKKISGKTKCKNYPYTDYVTQFTYHSPGRGYFGPYYSTTATKFWMKIQVQTDCTYVITRGNSGRSYTNWHYGRKPGSGKFLFRNVYYSTWNFVEQKFVGWATTQV